MIDFSKGLFGGGDLIEAKPMDLDVLAPKIDTSKAVALFDKHKERIDAMIDAIADLQITDDADHTKATQMGVTVQGAIKEMDDLAANLTKPFKDAAKAVDNAKNVYTKRLESGKDVLISKIDLYIAAKELRERLLAKQRREEAERQQAELTKQAEELGVDAPQINIPDIAPKGDNVIRTAKGSGFQKKDTVVKVVDESLLPREYLQPNMPKIRKAAKAGKEIPGVETKEVKKTQFRTAKS
jgi:hypothetical protein